MTDTPPNQAARTGWHNYWLSERFQPAFPLNGRLAAILDSHWERMLGDVVRPESGFRSLEVAAGNGMLSSRLAKHLGQSNLPDALHVACDLSQGAALNLSALAGIQSLRCDASKLPFPSGHFEMTMSQFGIEYAGFDAVAELARVTAPRGSLALVAHHQDGALYRENLTVLKAVAAFRESGLLAEFAVLSAAPTDAGRLPLFAAAVKRAEAVLHRHGREVAGGSLLNVYREVATMHAGLARYDHREIMEWCARTQDSLRDYENRTRWMLDAAWSESDIAHATALLESAGFWAPRARAILDEARQSHPVAWSLVAKRAAES